MNLVALSRDGSTMSTVETRLPEEGIGSLVTLKFWACGSQNKQFNLSTVIYEPHRFIFFLNVFSLYAAIRCNFIATPRRSTMLSVSSYDYDIVVSITQKNVASFMLYSINETGRLGSPP